jgi:Icc-related predicted phosphoesterase
MNQEKFRICAIGDVHYGKHSKGKLQELFTSISAAADVLLICGDLTDYGLPEEAALLATDLQRNLKIPCLAVLGNHDYESGHGHEVSDVMSNAGVEMLNGECFKIRDVGFAGICGFGGGFGSAMLNAWGEPAIKNFVQEAVDQSLRLEKALSGLTEEKKIVLLHYSPIHQTVVGENPEIFPFMGSSRLEHPINQAAATAVFHGHAHGGSVQGVTSAGIPVYNASMPLLQKVRPNAPFVLLEV